MTIFTSGTLAFLYGQQRKRIKRGLDTRFPRPCSCTQWLSPGSMGLLSATMAFLSLAHSDFVPGTTRGKGSCLWAPLPSRYFPTDICVRQFFGCSAPSKMSPIKVSLSLTWWGEDRSCAADLAGSSGKPRRKIPRFYFVLCSLLRVPVAANSFHL